MKKTKRDCWDDIFKKEGKVFTSPHKDMPRVARMFKKHGVKRVLDLGCGSGRHSVYLARRGFEVSGIDISRHGIGIAKSWLKKDDLKADLRAGNIYKRLPYKDNFFDAIVSTQTIHHGRIGEIRRLIGEMKRILRPGGLVFVTVSKRASRKRTPKRRPYKIKYIAPRTCIKLDNREDGLPHYMFNKELLKKEFSGFKVIDLWVEESQRHYCMLGRLDA